MNELFDERVRRIVPRWRDAATTTRLGELGSLSAAERRFTTDSLQTKIVDWTESPSLFVATDLLGTAVMLEESQEQAVREAAAFVLNPDSGASLLARRAAQQIAHDTDVVAEDLLRSVTRSQVYSQIHQTKRRLTGDPRNAIGWADLAYLYTLAGQLRQSRRAMEVALLLAPESRFVLRSATRLFVHDDDPKRALDLLRRSHRTSRDPWLSAAEIAVSGVLDAPPKTAKLGLAMAASRSFSPRDISELTSALGTLEAEHGNRRKARKLFEVSLEDPNENALAQVAWATREAQVVVDVTTMDVPFSFEARGRFHFRRGEWEAALREGEGWLNDQPFSVAAAAFPSYVAGVVLGQHEIAISALRRGLIANPDDWTLLNNLAFSLASRGDVEEANEEFSRIASETDNPSRHGVWLATSGLLAFRGGDAVEGQRLYDEAIALFERNRLSKERAVAAILKAREALVAKLETASEMVAFAKDAAAQIDLPEIAALIEQIERPANDPLPLR